MQFPSARNRKCLAFTRLFHIEVTNQAHTVASCVDQLHRRARANSRGVPPLNFVSRWEFLPELEEFLTSSSLKLRDVSKIAWSLNKLVVDDGAIWSKLLKLIVCSTEANPSDMAVILFSLANSLGRDSCLVPAEELEAILRVIESRSQDSKFLNSLSLCDCAQLCYSLAVIFPGSSSVGPVIRRAIEHLSQLPLTDGVDPIPQLSSCRDVCLLWSVARLRIKYRNKLSASLTEALCEASRGLRLCPDFNQNKAAQLAECLAVLSVDDPRAVFQVVHFLDKQHKSVNANNIIRITRSMGRLRISNAILWKRIGNRLEDSVGLRLTLDELDEIKEIFRTVGAASQRTFGILDLYMRTKADAQKFDPAITPIRHS